MSQKIKIGIIGGAGYTGGELVRLLLNHPNAQLQYVVSKSQQGKDLYEIHQDLTGETDLAFCATAEKGADLTFLCMSHGDAKKFLDENKFLYDAKIIDLSRDFRISRQSTGDSWQETAFIYGLPELNREKIKKANYIANPGCFATAIQLGLLPLAAKGLLNADINVNATTGSTGAGRSLNATTHFSWRNDNLSVYKVFEHEHLAEINQSIKQLQNSFSDEISFIPQRGAFSRGILAAITVNIGLSQSEVENLFKIYYAEHPFVHLVKTVDVKQITNTNKCFMQLIKHKNQLAIVTVIDNLLKGASGQAVQNMNLMFGLEETTGLKLKANVY
ncbi:MAG TPA: N-acetyl-gamma-glutamyl-phosphate reductase [Bacteroidia bacterium]|jgi:N-acetyl-gamma-glutamyl-phosphate reductase|nr:N-acetyl-gamma-glutamyl-phosphate reductase [Bacteroidia bacterium]